MQQNGDDTRGTSAASGDAESRTRPERRSVEDRQQAVLELLGGKATVDQVARRRGVKPETVEGSRAEAREGMRESLSRAGESPQERTAEKAWSWVGASAQPSRRHGPGPGVDEAGRVGVRGADDRLRVQERVGGWW